MINQAEKKFFSVSKKNLLLYYTLAVAIMMVAVNFSVPLVLTCLLLFLDFAGVLFLFRKTIGLHRKNFLWVVFFASLFLRVVAVFAVAEILVYFTGEPYKEATFGDDYRYFLSSSEIYSYWNNGYRSLAGSGIAMSTGAYSGYPIFGALMMKVFGVNVYSARIGNAIFSTFSVLLFYLICEFYTDQRNARFVTCIFALYPLAIVTSALQLKDTLLFFFILLEMYGVILFVRTKKYLLSSFCVVVPLVSLLTFRPAVSFLLISILLLMILYLLFAGRRIYFSKSAIGKLIALTAFSIVALVSIWGNLSKGEYVDDMNEYVDSRYSVSGKNLSETGAGAGSFSYSKYLGAPLYMVFTPFLPVFSAVNYSYDNTINIDFASVVFHMSVLPFLIMALINILTTNYRYSFVPVFLLVSYFGYRFMQAFNALSSFSPRQSMPALIIMLLMLPCALERPFNKRVYVLSTAVSILIVVAFNFVRMRSHGML